MTHLFYELLEFFGIATEAPQNLGEFLPWFLSVLVALALFLFVFNMIRNMVNNITRPSRW